MSISSLHGVTKSEGSQSLATNDTYYHLNGTTTTSGLEIWWLCNIKRHVGPSTAIEILTAQSTLAPLFFVHSEGEAQVGATTMTLRVIVGQLPKRHIATET